MKWHDIGDDLKGPKTANIESVSSQR